MLKEPINIADFQLDGLWDATFQPLWKFLVGSVLRQYPTLSVPDAEDIAAEVIHRLVKYFRAEEFRSLTREHQIARVFDFAKKTVRSVMAQAYADKKRESTVERDSLLKNLSRTYSSDKLRDAFNLLKREDQIIIRCRGIERLSYQQIQERWLNEFCESLSEDALKMRFSRAVKVFDGLLKSQL